MTGNHFVWKMLDFQLFGTAFVHESGVNYLTLGEDVNGGRIESSDNSFLEVGKKKIMPLLASFMKRSKRRSYRKNVVSQKVVHTHTHIHHTVQQNVVKEPIIKESDTNDKKF